MLLNYPNCSGFNECTKRIAGKSVVDVGANFGGYTSTFLEHRARRIVAVEPAPKIAEALRERFKEDPVDVIQGGLSDAPGRIENITFRNCWTLADAEHPISSKISDLSPEALSHQPEPFDVELRTLDEVVDTYDLHDLAFLKIDTDGYEPQVIRGGARTLKTLRPDALLELSYLPHEMGESIPDFVRHIYALDYTIATLDGRLISEKAVLENFPWNTSLDVLMLPIERYTHWPNG